MSDRRAILFFDDECLMCSTSVRWLHRLDEGDRLRFAPLGGETARENDLPASRESIVFLQGGETYRFSEGVRRVFLEVGGLGWVLGAGLSICPRPLRDWVYRVIASQRDRLSRFFTTSCEVPDEGLRSKLLP